MLQSAGEGREPGEKLAQCRERGLGSQPPATETSLSSHPQLRREIPDCSPSAQGSCLVAVFLPAPARHGCVSRLGSVPVEMSSGSTQEAEGVLCVFSLNHPCHSPKRMSPPTASPVGAAGTPVFADTEQRGPMELQSQILLPCTDFLQIIFVSVTSDAVK